MCMWNLGTEPDKLLLQNATTFTRKSTWLIDLKAQTSPSECIFKKIRCEIQKCPLC